jgi:hypothetical protein
MLKTALFLCCSINDSIGMGYYSEHSRREPDCIDELIV